METRDIWYLETLQPLGVSGSGAVELGCPVLTNPESLVHRQQSPVGVGPCATLQYGSAEQTLKMSPWVKSGDFSSPWPWLGETLRGSWRPSFPLTHRRWWPSDKYKDNNIITLVTWSGSPPKFATLSWTQERAATMSCSPWLPCTSSLSTLSQPRPLRR